MQEEKSPQQERTLVGIDVGGTFTDFVVIEAGQLRIHKVSTTPDDQSRAIVTGLHELGIGEAEIVHGMTVATNALLERRGAKTALLTTEGFADVLLIGRQNRPHLYRLSQRRPPSLVPEELRLEVPERIDASGIVLTPLDEAAVARIATQLQAEQVESLAIIFLFSFLNPIHEQRAAAIIRQQLPDLPISLSSDILPEYREFERTATTVINAYVQPLVSRYLARLEEALAGRRETGRQEMLDRETGDARQEDREMGERDARGEGTRNTPPARAPGARNTLRIMQSNGGAIGLAQAADQAARLVLSGPAGGVVGAFAIAKQASLPHLSTSDPQLPSPISQLPSPQLITFDMGGTSSDVALCPGVIPTTAESMITNLPLRLPVIDIHTVGAGGGSIAYVDAGGGLRVGPRSAGAVPGPVCYGRGGTEPTVTDANLLLGRLDPGGFLGGSGDVTLDVDGARRALSKLGQQLELSTEATALGVIQVVNASMERALRRVSVERGYDPRQFTLVPFGGAGALHACDLADALSIERILIPLFPGVLSAYGMLVADIANDASQSVLQSADELVVDVQPLRVLFTELSEKVRTVLHEEGITKPTIGAALDVRYQGQSYELTVPFALTPTKETNPDNQQVQDQAALQEAVAAFHTAHEQRYGYAMREEQVQIVTLRVHGSGPGATPELPQEELSEPDAHDAQLADKAVWFDNDQPTMVTCYQRGKLHAGNQIDGPALVFQYDATVVISPGWNGVVDGYHNLWLIKII